MTYVKRGSKGSYAISYKTKWSSLRRSLAGVVRPSFSLESFVSTVSDSGRDFSSAWAFQPRFGSDLFLLNGYANPIVAFGRLGGLLGDLWYMIMDRNPFLH